MTKQDYMAMCMATETRLRNPALIKEYEHGWDLLIQAANVDTPPIKSNIQPMADTDAFMDDYECEWHCELCEYNRIK